jgi:hypothetical protein
MRVVMASSQSRAVIGVTARKTRTRAVRKASGRWWMYQVVRKPTELFFPVSGGA